MFPGTRKRMAVVLFMTVMTVLFENKHKVEGLFCYNYKGAASKEILNQDESILNCTSLAPNMNSCFTNINISSLAGEGHWKESSDKNRGCSNVTIDPKKLCRPEGSSLKVCYCDTHLCNGLPPQPRHSLASIPNPAALPFIVGILLASFLT